VWLDYTMEGRRATFLPSLSAGAVAGEYLRTASDEMRTIECLAIQLGSLPRAGACRPLRGAVFARAALSCNRHG
jgi:hypothetical protein